MSVVEALEGAADEFQRVGGGLFWGGAEGGEQKFFVAEEVLLLAGEAGPGSELGVGVTAVEVVYDLSGGDDDVAALDDADKFYVTQLVEGGAAGYEE